jgi:malate permease and related proteins
MRKSLAAFFTSGETMIEQFYNFQSTALGVLQLCVMALIGFLLFARGVLTRDGCRELNNLLLWVLLPALIVAQITEQFKPGEMPTWWLLPLSSVAMSLLGVIIGALVVRCGKRCAVSREFMLSIAFQNCVYLPMTLVAFVCTGDVCSPLLVDIFLFSVGFNLFVWAFSIPFLHKKNTSTQGVNLFSIFNPPALGTIISVIAVFIWGTGWLPHTIVKPLELMGNTSFPLALILLGASLAEHRGYHLTGWSVAVRCLVTKLVLLPLVVFLFLKILPISHIHDFMIFLQATMPSAVTLVVIGEYAHADNRFFSGVILYSHLFSCVAICF